MFILFWLFTSTLKLICLLAHMEFILFVKLNQYDSLLEYYLLRQSVTPSPEHFYYNPKFTNYGDSWFSVTV